MGRFAFFRMTPHARRRLAVAVMACLLVDLLWIGARFPFAMRHHRFQAEQLPVLRLPVLVLGAGVNPDKEPSPVLQGRLQTALDLYRSGKASWILVSGDNRTNFYNEPQAMRRWLQRHGVPPTAIVADYAGRRTWDSLRRAQAVFGIQRLIIVTSGFHLARAMFIARQLGMEAWGVPAIDRDVSLPARASFWIREHFARHAAILDSWFPPATRLGPREPTPDDWNTPESHP